MISFEIAFIIPQNVIQITRRVHFFRYFTGFPFKFIEINWSNPWQLHHYTKETYYRNKIIKKMCMTLTILYNSEKVRF